MKRSMTKDDSGTTVTLTIEKGTTTWIAELHLPKTGHTKARMTYRVEGAITGNKVLDSDTIMKGRCTARSRYDRATIEADTAAHLGGLMVAWYQARPAREQDRAAAANIVANAPDRYAAAGL